ncbi:uncharacterized protein YlxW (UPF0749 family) [Sediminihabitans luteus]|uniref:Uncharacterized protein YlxW (UPF0749 family) n=1 Tax=Sediminihabitans luteus TaxID=1138585 RepID=A0A2M9CQX3_9CELL|nr:DUF881 domain-containing protein [Sediminihabitans luteus]PJJ74235.1 uncharacterized protein YlxW (UPF0749 family) [Sediminihabitans luteus]GII99088.1 hypothetical protein Slu03_14660 [Sediminihabitans luteus]
MSTDETSGGMSSDDLDRDSQNPGDAGHGDTGHRDVGHGETAGGTTSGGTSSREPDATQDDAVHDFAERDDAVRDEDPQTEEPQHEGPTDDDRERQGESVGAPGDSLADGLGDAGAPDAQVGPEAEPTLDPQPTPEVGVARPVRPRHGQDDVLDLGAGDAQDQPDHAPSDADESTDEWADDSSTPSDAGSTEVESTKPGSTDPGSTDADSSGADAPLTGRAALVSMLSLRRSRGQMLAAVLCGLLGFALVVQVSSNRDQDLSSLRQSDLVRLLDEVTQRTHTLEDQVDDLESTRDELQSGADGKEAALELAQQQAVTEGILAGRLAVHGPGIEITVMETGDALPAASMFNILEELRNAGAEAVAVNGVRLVASSYFERTDDGLVVDGQVITSPYRWSAIGDPPTMETALEIPGGAMASVRTKGADETIRQLDDLTIDDVADPQEAQFATPVPEPAKG